MLHAQRVDVTSTSLMRGLACEKATLVSVRLRKAPLLKLGVGPCFLPQLARRAAGSYMHYLGWLMCWHDFLSGSHLELWQVDARLLQ